MPNIYLAYNEAVTNFNICKSVHLWTLFVRKWNTLCNIVHSKTQPLLKNYFKMIEFAFFVLFFVKIKLNYP